MNASAMSRPQLEAAWAQAARQVERCRARIRELETQVEEARLKNELLGKVLATKPVDERN